MSDGAFRKRIRELAHDRLAGAREIIGWFLDTLRDQIEDTPTERHADILLEAAGIIIPSQPSMAPLLHAMDRLFHAADDRTDVLDAVDGLIDQLDRSLKTIAERAVPRLAEVQSVATLSWSTTVMHVLEKLGRPITVHIAESRPGGEGRRSAERAAKMDHAVHFHPDSTFPGAAATTDMLLLGGDALTPGGLVNKVGSRAAARECRSADVPVVAVVDPLKVIGPGLAERLRVLPQDPLSLWERPPKGVTVVCHYFELVPLHLVSEVLGLDGVTDPHEILQQLVSASPASYWEQVPPPAEGTRLEAAVG